MGEAEYTRPAPGPAGGRSGSPHTAQVVVVGSASRDVAADDPRGWRLGGGVTYGALTTARLGLRTAALIGVDADAAAAWELDLLREAGVELVVARLPRGPIFENREQPEGRVQIVRRTRRAAGRGAAPARLGAASAGCWRRSPVSCPTPGRRPAARRLRGLRLAGHPASPRGRPARAPAAAGALPLLLRADLVGVSRHDLPARAARARVCRWLGREDELLLTCGDRGRAPDRPRRAPHPAPGALPAGRRSR